MSYLISFRQRSSTSTMSLLGFVTRLCIQKQPGAYHSQFHCFSGWHKKTLQRCRSSQEPISRFCRLMALISRQYLSGTSAEGSLILVPRNTFPTNPLISKRASKSGNKLNSFKPSAEQQSNSIFWEPSTTTAGLRPGMMKQDVVSVNKYAYKNKNFSAANSWA